MMLTSFVMASFFLAFSAQAQSQSNLPNGCQNFEDIEQQTNWWMQEYGALLTSGSLFLDVSQGEDLRIGQLFLMLRELDKTGIADLQKHLTIAVELYTLLDARNSVNTDTVYDLLHQSARSELLTQSTDFRRLQSCAFECPTGLDGGLSDEFRSCIAD
jgi:hypothetical protein